MSNQEVNSSESKVFLEVIKDVAFVRLGVAQERAVTFNQSRLESLENLIDDIAVNDEINSVIFISSQAAMFCAGVDISLIEGVKISSKAQELASWGQSVFNKIADLRQFTIAAISGACVGGGCELALACDTRIMTDNPKSRIGLPETKLGIIPGFGGCQRLPRLIGLPSSLEMILSGRLLDSSRAKKKGLIDEVVTAHPNVDIIEELEKRAFQIATEPNMISNYNMPFMDKVLTHSFVRSFICNKASQQANKKTRGKYPAMDEAINCIKIGLSNGIKQGLEAEAKSIGRLAVSPESKSLVHIFKLTEKVSKLGRPCIDDVKNSTVGVIGAGVMGAGIASTCLASGLEVKLVDINEKVREKAKKSIEKYIHSRRSLSEADKNLYLSKLILTDSLNCLKDCSIIIEAVNEDIELKKKILKSVWDICGNEDIIYSSNTSSLSISEIASVVGAPENILGIHFFNPVEKMPLVEIIQSDYSNEKSILFSAAFTTILKKYPIVVTSVPGFLINRILTPYLIEASRILKEGYSPEIIDKVALDFGMPMGPIRLLDEIGLDIAHEVQNIIVSAYGERMGEVPDYINRLSSKGMLGKKTGTGFYIHEDKKAERNPEIESILDINLNQEADKKAYKEIEDRLILTMVNEAVMCLDEGVAGFPGKDAAEQVDLGTVMGLGFAPFRGGLLHYANSRGAKNICKSLEVLAKNHGDHFTPCDGLQKRSNTNSSFYDPVE